MDSAYPETVTSILPEHPENVIHSEDGDSNSRISVEKTFTEKVLFFDL